MDQAGLDEVPEEIVQKCFDKCGFSNVVQNNERTEEEEDQEFAELVRRFHHVGFLLIPPSPTGDND